MNALESQRNKGDYLREAIKQLPVHQAPEDVWYEIEMELDSTKEVETKNPIITYRKLLLVACICLFVGTGLGLGSAWYLNDSPVGEEGSRQLPAAPPYYDEFWEEEVGVIYKGGNAPDVKTMVEELRKGIYSNEAEFDTLKKRWDQIDLAIHHLTSSGVAIPLILLEEREKIINSYEKWRWEFTHKPLSD